MDRSGDVFETSNAPTYDWFAPGWLDGTDTSWYDQVQSIETGNTVYEQQMARLVFTGPLFELPAGEVLGGFGVEGRKYEINDQPSANSQAGNLWGQSSALPTVGEEDVFEYYGEIEVPIISGQPGFEELTANFSARGFNYSTYGTGDVWKAQLNWQILPSFRVRGTQGTTFRAPGLFETFQGETTSFLSQFSIDPCVEYELSGNDNLRANCAADGVPVGYTPVGSSATIVSGGGGSILTPETSDTQTFGIVFTPSFANISIAIDYFNITVDDQIAQLGANTILGACYTADTFPNAFCSLFDRNSAGAALDPLAITEVRDFYININNQETEGFDFNVLYEREFDFGTLEFEGQATRTTEDVINLFSLTAESGFEEDDFNGTIGDPEWVFNTRLSVERGDVTLSWFTDYIGEGDNTSFNSAAGTYNGVPAFFIRKTPSVLYHDLSVRYEQDTWALTAGVQNIFDEAPPPISGSASLVSRRGQVPLSAGYDLRGRTGFVQLTKTF